MTSIRSRRLSARAVVSIALAAGLLAVTPSTPAGAIDGAETVSIFAGTGADGPSGDGGLATEAELSEPGQIAVATDGTVYITDSGEETVRQVKHGVITTIVGASQTTGVDEPAVSALVQIDSLELGPGGLMYFTDRAIDTVWKIDESGILRRVAGNGTSGFSGDGGQATDAQLSSPSGLAFGPDGSLYFSDNRNSRIRRVDPDGVITTIAGTGTRGYAGDGGPAIDAELGRPTKLTVDRHGNVYFYDSDSDRLRKVNTSGVIDTIVGNGVPSTVDLAVGTEFPALEIDLDEVQQLDFDDSDVLHIATHKQILRLEVDVVVPAVTSAAPPVGDPITDRIAGDIWGMAFGPNGDMYVSTDDGDLTQQFVYLLEAHPNCLSGPVDDQWQTSDTSRASIYRLYCAYFQRVPDTGGYDYWHTQFNTEVIDLTEISDFFSASDEFVNTYGDLSNEEFVDLLYSNVLQRTADSEGRAYWLGILDDGILSRGLVLLQFSESQEFRNRTGTP